MTNRAKIVLVNVVILAGVIAFPYVYFAWIHAFGHVGSWIGIPPHVRMVIALTAPLFIALFYAAYKKLPWHRKD